jgi:hypothetical protein
MTSSTDFHTWLATLPALGYDRDWIRRNMHSLQERFDADPSPMQPCPQPSVKARDRYEEL